MPKNLPLDQSVLIVGAGAHVPYAFPTGQQLTNIVKTIYKDPKKVILINKLDRIRSEMGREERYKYELCDIARLLVIVKPPEKPTSSNDYDIRLGNSLSDFLRSFCESQVYSIDTYLSKISTQKSDEATLIKSDWGRLIVAYLISEHEKQMPFGTQEFNWIQFIIDRYLKNNLELFFERPPKIITFNYDRFLERCLYKHLVEYHSVREGEAKSMVDRLPILHVYGRLGCYTNWESSDKKSFFSDAINNIQVIGEHRSEEQMAKTSSTIREWLSSCQKAYFLGYGFDTINNQLLMSGLPSDWSKYCSVFSTNIGIKKSDINAISESLAFEPKYLRGTTSLREVYPIDLLRELEPLEKETKSDAAVSVTRS